MSFTVGSILKAAQLNTLENNISASKTDIVTLQGQMTTANTNVSTLQGQMTTANTNISTNTSDITTIKTSGWSAGAVTTVGTGLAIGSKTLNANWTLGSVTALGANLTLSSGTLNAVVSGGTIARTINAQVGTTYTVLNADNNLTVTFNNAGAVAVTLPQAGGGGNFLTGWWVSVINVGAGTVTITPTTSTINGATSLTITGGAGGGTLVSDGTNYRWIPEQSFYWAPNGALSNYLTSFPTATIAGNSRGANALDIQSGRAAASEVASGSGSIAVGYRVSAIGSGCVSFGNIASSNGTNSTALGSSASTTQNQATAVGTSVTASGVQATAIGYNTTASGTGANAIGNTCTAQGDYSIAIGASANVLSLAHRSMAFGQGYVNTSASDCIVFGCNSTTLYGKKNAVIAPDRADDRANVGGLFFSPNNLGGSSSLTGRSQTEDYLLIGSTSGASALRLTTDAAAAGAANVVNLGTSQAMQFTVDVLIANTVTGASWTFSLATSLLRKDATNASTALYANAGGVVAGPTTTAPPALGANPTVTVDTTNGGLNISFTPPAANTNLYYAVARVSANTTRWN